MAAMAKKLDFASTLRKRLRGTLVVLGMGNPSRGDDGAGPRLVEMLIEMLESLTAPRLPVHVLNGRETPENYIGQVVRLRPDTVIVLDCASLGLCPGEVRIVEADDPLGCSPSTHGLSPSLLMSQLKEETGADVFMVAVQPATTAFEEGLSAPVSRALTELADLIERIVRGK